MASFLHCSTCSSWSSTFAPHLVIGLLIICRSFLLLEAMTKSKYLIAFSFKSNNYKQINQEKKQRTDIKNEARRLRGITLLKAKKRRLILLTQYWIMYILIEPKIISHFWSTIIIFVHTHIQCTYKNIEKPFTILSYYFPPPL